MNKTIFASLLALSLTVVPAYAAGLGLKVETNLTAKLPTIVTRSDDAINARITSLNNLATRVGEMKNVSASEKTNISAEVQTNITGLTALKAKIDADTDVTVALTDEKSIFGSFRIYALVIPRGYIVAAADRATTIGSMLTSVGVKLQTRITAAQAAGKDVTALNAALTDLTAKVGDANTQASTAQTNTVSLTPDQGDKTKAEANHVALVAARANIKTATTDLKAARADAQTIIQGLKAFHLSATASSTAQ